MTREEAIKIVRNIYQTDAEKEALGTLIPELAESEDERIRKFICSIIDNLEPKDFVGVKKMTVLAWLEKQKEQEWNKKPCLTCQEYEKGFKQGRLEGFTAGYNKAMVEQKGLDVTDFCQPINPDIAKVLPDVINELTWGDDEQKEQKPVDPSDDELQRHQDELYGFKVFAAKQAKEHHISFVHDFEWNNFCAEILSYFNEQKQEWSEEDEINVGWLISYLKGENAGEYYDEMMRESLVDWLKSLRPQYNGDVTMTEAYKMGKEAGEASSWKPSEEQMEELNKARRFIPYNCDVLEALYNQLKKL